MKVTQSTEDGSNVRFDMEQVQRHPPKEICFKIPRDYENLEQNSHI